MFPLHRLNSLLWHWCRRLISNELEGGGQNRATLKVVLHPDAIAGIKGLSLAWEIRYRSRKWEIDFPRTPLERMMLRKIRSMTSHHGLFGFSVGAGLLCSLLIPASQAEEALSGEALKFFENKIRPVLAENCYGCHGEEKAKGGLRVDHIDAILKGGDTGPALVKGDSEASLIIEVVRRDDPDFAMPPKEKDALSEEQVADLAKWIAMGAPWPATDTFTEVERDEHGFTAEDKAWWAVQPLADVKVPDAGREWAKNEIDPFIYRSLKAKGLEPSEPASAEEMVRRMHFDLIGLPPSTEVVAAFSAAYAKDPDKAVAEEVDRLLADPRYGERWGQHWLDVVRYSDSDGYNADGYRPDAWRYRDYVINSLNDDKPYDQFVREQLAADEFAADDPDKLIATAFLRHGVYEWNQRNAEMQWDLIITEMTNVTGEVFLGVGVGCAQCHDHKFDPILQKDYFALQSFLNATWWPEDRTLATPEQRAEYNKQLAKWEEATKDVRAELDKLTKTYYENSRDGASKVFPDPVKEMYAKDPEERTAYEEQISQLVQRQVDHAKNRLDFKKKFEKDEKKLALYNELQEKLKKFDDIKPEPLPVAFISTDVGTEPAVTKFSQRGGKVAVEPAFFTLLDQPAPKITPTETTTGRRTALANWITREDNPLSTRVIVNRLWQHHFAKGLVPTPNDFGRLGEEPSHPELLDWLTRDFLNGGWKMKRVHRLIMTSATYRQTARRKMSEKESVADSGNRLLWRYPPKRLDAEQIRDAMLFVSGELQQRDGGASIDGSATNRSVYVKRRRNSRDALIGNFDAPLGFASAPDRLSTTTPNQSLMMVNGDFSRKRATAFAKRILDGKTKIEAEDIREAYLLAYGREAQPSEVESALYFLGAHEEFVEGPAEAPRKFPNETGLRPTSQVFGDGKALGLGENSLWIQPGSRFERLAVKDVELPSEEFTIEAVANLDRLYPDASVNTLVSRWNGSTKTPGWNLGVTSEKSGFKPRNFIVQLTGETFQHEPFYEVVASNLRFPLQTPTYIAAAISAKPAKDDVTKGSVTFYMKELGKPDAPLQVQTVEHQVVGGLDASSAFRTLIGGRDRAKGHLWDGQLGRLIVSNGILSPDQLIINGGKGSPEGKRIIDWNFSGKDGEHPAPNTAWLREAADPSGIPLRLLGSTTDFCQVLLNSNEFLYLH